MDWMTDYGMLEPLPPEQFPWLRGELVDLLVMDDEPGEEERDFVLSLVVAWGERAPGRTLTPPSW